MLVLVHVQNPPHGPHLGAMLEIVHDHLAAGDEVVALVCHGQFETCWLNPDHLPSRCLRCRAGEERGWRQLRHPRLRVEVMPGQSAPDLVVPAFADIAELQRWTHAGVAHGVGMASSLISEVRDTAPDPARHRARIAALARTSVAFHRTIAEACARLRPQRFYVQNGRVCELRAAFLAARAAGVAVGVVADIAPGSDRYIVFSDGTPHELAIIKRAIAATWDDSPLPESERRAIARALWDDLREHRSPLWSYANRQERDLLPAELKPPRRLVAIFNSSEDEMAAFDEFRLPGHASQEDAIRHLLALPWPEDLHFVLRIHPNLAGIDNTQTRALAGLRHPRLHVIPAAAPADSYALLTASTAVITYGSTMGIEALHWQRPSILLGRAPYEDLAGVLRPADDAALMAAVLRPPTVVERSGADRYGFFFARAGTAFTHYRHDQRTDRGRWNGHPLFPSLVQRAWAAVLTRCGR